MAEKSKLGLIQVITGEGKGKTTSAIGGAVRAKGRGLRVLILQFFKRDTGEYEVIKGLDIPYFQFKPSHQYFKDYKEEQLEDIKKELLNFWNEHTKDLTKYDILIVDEMGPALNWKIFDPKILIKFLKNKPENLEIVLTGRDFPKTITEIADYVSEIKLKKHPYEKGVVARKGIEF